MTSYQKFNSMNIRDKVYNYPTKHKEGFVQAEVDSLLNEYQNIDREKFNCALMGNTVMVIDNDIIQYHCDIEKALLFGIEK